MNTLRINHTARRRAEALISNYARRLLQIDEKNLGLLEEHLSQTQEPELPDVIENRQNPCWVVPPHGSNTSHRALTVTALKAEILDAIDKNQIIFISGGTGCGKSTQVPQYILERAFERKEPVNVVISMPRRLPTATLCKRITEEFGEAEGETIAHKIRHEDTDTYSNDE